MTQGSLVGPLGGTLACLRPPPAPPSTEMRGWTFRFSCPPYDGWGPGVGADRLVERASGLRSGALVAAYPRGLDPEGDLGELDWWLREVPWCAPVLMVDGSWEGQTVAAFLLRAAKRGILVLDDPGSSPGDAATLLRKAMDPEAELPFVLEIMAPLWEPRSRAAAGDLLRAGVRSTRDAAAAGAWGSVRQVLFRVGRALGACVALQRAQESADSAPPWRTGIFATEQSMGESVWRLFGVHLEDVARSAGWWWLPWLFLAGGGKGRAVGYTARPAGGKD